MIIRLLILLVACLLWLVHPSSAAVKSRVSPAPTASITVSPSELDIGQSGTLTWNSTHATGCSGTNFSTDGATSGSLSGVPAETTTYSVTCTGPGGRATVSASVLVGETIGSNQGIMWGVNGHPVQGGPYTAIPLAQQMATIVDTGLVNYRIDLYDATSASLDVLTTAVAAGKEAGVEILPILIPSPLSYTTTTAAYDAGYAMAETYAAQFPNVHVWELGNEYDGLITIDGDGSNISQYNAAQFALVEATISGLLNGMRAGNPVAKGIVDTEGVCHYGFTDGLWDDGVQWDITGEHWYLLAGNITDMTGFCTAGPLNKIALLQRHYGKPIWITEFGDNSDPANKTQMADWLTATMAQWNSIARTYDLESAQIYELYDQPNAPAGIEQHFGIANSEGVPNTAGVAVQQFLTSNPSVTYH